MVSLLQRWSDWIRDRNIFFYYHYLILKFLQNDYRVMKYIKSLTNLLFKKAYNNCYIGDDRCKDKYTTYPL